MRSFKKIAAMIMAVAMLCSFTALGAEVNIGEIVVTEDNFVTIPFTAKDVEEVTALVYSGEDLSGANLVYIDQFDADAYTDNNVSALPAFKVGEGAHTVLMGGTGLSTATSKSFTGKEELVEEWTVTVAETENGYIKAFIDGEEADLSSKITNGTKINLEFAPYIGYELASFTIGGVDKTTSITNTKGVSTYAYTAEEDAEIVVTFKEVSVDAAEGGVHTSADIYDVEGTDDNDDKADDSFKLTFGKVVEAAGKDIDEYGMIVEVKNGDNWDKFYTKSGAGNYFKSLTGLANGAYGMRFFGFTAGTYRVTSYVKYKDAEGNVTEKTGAPVVFEVK